VRGGEGAPALVIGIGNPDRGDDGAAGAVIARLRERVPAGVRLKLRSGDLLRLLDDWTGCDPVILVDAAAPAVGAGTILRVEPAAQSLVCGRGPASSHGVGLYQAIDLARSLGRLPPRLVLYLIEGENFAAGGGLSPAIAAAVDWAAASILTELAGLS
jgi:hydrogenase maturation protease